MLVFPKLFLDGLFKNVSNDICFHMDLHIVFCEDHMVNDLGRSKKCSIFLFLEFVTCIG